MSIIKTDRFPTSEVLLRLPVSAAENLIMSGLTAPQWRLALVLVCLARGSNTVTLEKPRLEQLSGVTLNTVHKLMAPLMAAKLDLPGHQLDGQFIFEDIEYDGGKRGKSVGQIRASLTIAMGHFLAAGRNRVITLPADELRRYASVSSIILRLRFGAAFELGRAASGARIRITPSDVSTIFGNYGRVAVIKRPSTVTGEVIEHTSLSRAGAVLVDPAVNEINSVSRVMRLKSTVLMKGRNWTEIDLEAARISVRVSAPKPKPTIRIRPQPTRKVAKA